jgi:hypothetical protein
MARDRVDQEELRLLLQDMTNLLALLDGDPTYGNAAGGVQDVSDELIRP